MSDDDQVDARFRALEARIASLEAAARARLTPVNVAPPMAVPRQPITSAQPIVASAQPIVTDVMPRPPASAAPNPTSKPPASAPITTAAGPSWIAVIADLEEKLTGRALAVVGGVALVAGAIFFLSLAFSRG